MRSDMSSVQRDEVRTFWTGPPLSYYEILSLKSFVATGARVFLYSYDADLIVPDGVEILDAEDIVPLEYLKRYNSENPDAWSRHSDLMRYGMLHRFGGWYLDLDVICLKDRFPDLDLYFGRAGEERIYPTIMKFPAGSPALKDLIDTAKLVLPNADRAVAGNARAVIGNPLFSKVLKDHGLDQMAQPRSDAYEIAIHEMLLFFNPSQCETVQGRLRDKSFTHLWNGAWNGLRIPRNYGPPKGSFLDLMFRNFDIKVPELGRLQYDFLVSCVMEDTLLEEFKSSGYQFEFTRQKIDEFTKHIEQNGWMPNSRLYNPPRYQIDYGKLTSPVHAKAAAPQTLRTFWHGDSIGAYQLLCLKSFVDRGHSVEVFTYNPKLNVPAWLAVKDAADILPSESVLKPISPGGQLAIHADLFRYALLERRGGWWIDPDVVLLKPDMPTEDIYYPAADVFGLTPTAVLRFPPSHPVMKQAVARASAIGDFYENAGRSGSQLLTSVIGEHGLSPPANESASLGPITWLNVPDLFDPGKTVELSEKCADSHFLHLQSEVWRRAGIPQLLGPPQGAFLDELLTRHPVEGGFSARMEFDQLNRWIRHMYRSAQVQ